MSFFEQIEQWDQQLFLYLNGFHNPFWDGVMNAVSTPQTWVPLFLIIFYFIQRKYGWKGLGLMVVTMALLIAATDQTTNLFKNVLVERYRPCRNHEIGHLVHIVAGCAGKHGFFSGHSATFFAMTTFFGLLFRKKWLRLVFWLWAAWVAYSRIYLGVHYPLDIICGATCGILYGWLFARLYFKFGNRFWPDRISLKPVKT